MNYGENVMNNYVVQLMKEFSGNGSWIQKFRNALSTNLVCWCP